MKTIHLLLVAAISLATQTIPGSGAVNVYKVNAISK